MACLPDPRSAANRIKRVLHAVFETRFNFDLEDVKKKNLGPTVKWLEDLDGTTRFTVAFVVQASLGGHSIPLDAGTMAIVKLLDLVSEKDAEKGEVPGLERAIPKAKGVEFGSLLHQFAADFSANPYSPAVKGILLEVDPEVAGRLAEAAGGTSAKKIAEAKAEEAAEAAKPQAAEPKKGVKKEESKAEAGAKAGTEKEAPAAEKPAEAVRKNSTPNPLPRQPPSLPPKNHRRAKPHPRRKNRLRKGFRNENRVNHRAGRHSAVAWRIIAIRALAKEYPRSRFAAFL